MAGRVRFAGVTAGCFGGPPFAERAGEGFAEFPVVCFQAADVFAEMFRDPPDVTDPWWPQESEPEREFLRWLLGCGLSHFVGPQYADELIELAATRDYGIKRALIVKTLPKTKDPRVPGVLLSLLDDPTVKAFAVEALGLMRYAPARDAIARLAGHPDKHIRDQAKKALKRIDASLGRPNLNLQ